MAWTMAGALALARAMAPTEQGRCRGSDTIKHSLRLARRGRVIGWLGVYNWQTEFEIPIRKAAALRDNMLERRICK